MKPTLNIDNAVRILENTFGFKIINHTLPTEGADSLIILVKLDDLTECVIKIGGGADVDAQVLQDLSKYDIKVPKCLYAQIVKFNEGEEFVLIMSKMEGTLLRYIDLADRYRYIPLVISEMHKYHAIKSTLPGKYSLVNSGKSEPFIDSLAKMFIEVDSTLDWGAVKNTNLIDLNLLSQARQFVVEELSKINLDSYSLLQCDMHQSNIFVNETKVTGIIDWTYARYGDPLYDFALFHFNILKHMDEKAILAYHGALNLSPFDQHKEQVYLLCWVLENLYDYILDSDTGRISFALGIINQVLGK